MFLLNHSVLILAIWRRFYAVFVEQIEEFYLKRVRFFKAEHLREWISQKIENPLRKLMRLKIPGRIHLAGSEITQYNTFSLKLIQGAVCLQNAASKSESIIFL